MKNGSNMSTKPIKACQKLVSLLSGLAIIAIMVIPVAAAAQGSSTTGCNVPGFSFHPNQLPGLRYLKVPGKYMVNPFKLYTLPYTPPDEGPDAVCCGVNAIIPAPFENLPATVAGCEANAECGLFTSDGYIIGSYRNTENGGEEKADSEADVFEWQTMQYCTWACCGTWVADGLIDQLLQPIPDTPGANNVQSIRTGALPKDADYEYDLHSDLSTTVCVGKPPPRRKRNEIDQIPPGSPGCPKRCLPVCCKQLDEGKKRMDGYFFSQCSGPVCGILCGYGKAGVAAANSNQVLFKQYVREQSRGPIAAANDAGSVSNSSMPGCGSGDLC